MMIEHPRDPGAVLWLYAHPRHGSLNGRLCREEMTTPAAPHDVMTADRYPAACDPALTERDLGDLAGTPGNLAALAEQAYLQEQLPADIREEQAKLARAELLVVQFPLWWYGPPAILKGWFDRVLTGGFAHGDLDPELGVPRRYGDGGLAGRRALVVVTAGEDARSIGPRGISGDLESLLFPLTHGILWYVGIEPLDLHEIGRASCRERVEIAAGRGRGKR